MSLHNSTKENQIARLRFYQVKLIRDSVEMLQIRAEERDVILTMEGNPCLIQGNKQMIEELIYNLCDNAICYNNIGGGAFSGKDCTKVDRSAAYAARYVAKNIVAAGLADRCEIQLSYAIGVAQPTSIMVDTFGTGKIADAKIVEAIRENFDLRPAGIIKMLDLRRPIYKATAAYGHFGRTDVKLPWEELNKVDALKKYL